MVLERWIEGRARPEPRAFGPLGPERTGAEVAVDTRYTKFTLDVSEPSACGPLGAEIDGAASGL